MPCVKCGDTGTILVSPKRVDNDTPIPYRAGDWPMRCPECLRNSKANHEAADFWGEKTAELYPTDQTITN